MTSTALRRLVLLSASVVAVLAAQSQALASPVARQASRRSVNETASLHRTSRHGTIVTEVGTGSGTFRCPINLRIEVEEENLTFTFTCHTSAGLVSGGGYIHLHVADPVSKISGTASLSHGSGRYSRIHASGLRVTGTVVTSSYATTLHVTGSMSV